MRLVIRLGVRRNILPIVTPTALSPMPFPPRNSSAGWGMHRGTVILCAESFELTTVCVCLVYGSPREWWQIPRNTSRQGHNDTNPASSRNPWSIPAQLLVSFLLSTTHRNIDIPKHHLLFNSTIYTHSVPAVTPPIALLPSRPKVGHSISHSP